MKKQLIVIGLSTIIGLSGCGNDDASQESNSNQTNQEQTNHSDHSNHSEMNHSSSGEVPEGLKEAENPTFSVGIDKKLPEYNFEFKTMEFSNLLLSLETNKIDFIAHQMEVNEERQEKFLFNEEPYNVFPLHVAVNEKNNDIQSIKDLKGKKAIVGATSNSAVFLEKYNKEHNAGIEIVYSGQGADDTTNQIRNGRADATITTPFAVDFLNEQADAQQKVVGEPLLNSKVYFLLRKDETTLQGQIDKALVELRKEGVISELSKKWLGADYTVEF